MAKAQFEQTKPHLNVGRIGHIDHSTASQSSLILPRIGWEVRVGGGLAGRFQSLAVAGQGAQQLLGHELTHVVQQGSSAGADSASPPKPPKRPPMVLITWGKNFPRFEQGDIHHPVIIGGLWNGKDQPPTLLLTGFQPERDGAKHFAMVGKTRGTPQPIEILASDGRTPVAPWVFEASPCVWPGTPGGGYALQFKANEPLPEAARAVAVYISSLPKTLTR